MRTSAAQIEGQGSVGEFISLPGDGGSNLGRWPNGRRLFSSGVLDRICKLLGGIRVWRERRLGLDGAGYSIDQTPHGRVFSGGGYRHKCPDLETRRCTG